MGNVCCVIQARMGSSRLPGKVMRVVAGRPILAHVVERVQQCKGVTEVIVATTNLPEDEIIMRWCEEHQVKVLGLTKKLANGQNDVLARFGLAAQLATNDILMRVTADCALWCPILGAEVVEAYLTGKFQYVSNVHPWCDGFDTEVFSRAALEEADTQAVSDYDRMHVTPYMRLHAVCGYVDHLSLLVNAKLSIDTREDFDRAVAILERVQDFSWQETMRVAQGVQQS